MCGDAVSFLPKTEPEFEPQLEHQFVTLEGEDCEDWAQLDGLVAQLAAATSNLHTSQKTAQQQEAGSAAVVSSNLKALIQEKQRTLTPSIIASARSRLAELQAEEQQHAQEHPPACPAQEQQKKPQHTPLELPPVYKKDYVHQRAESSRSKLEQLQTQDQQGAEPMALELGIDCMDWVEALGGQDTLDEFLAAASAEMEALGVPPGHSLFPPPATLSAVPGMVSQEPVDKEEKRGKEIKEEDFVQRWEHVAPGFAERMKKAEVDGYYNVIDSKILARQSQLVADGSAAVCDALNVEVRFYSHGIQSIAKIAKQKIKKMNFLWIHTPPVRFLSGDDLLSFFFFFFFFFFPWQDSIDQAIKDLVQRKRCEEWNWKIVLAVQQNLDHW